MTLVGRYGFAMSLPIASTKTERPTTTSPWVLSDRTLTVFYGCPEMPRLSHYFLPRLLFAKKQILYLDGANQISPLLLARFARERGVDGSSVNTLIRVARAFTCFQLTELVRRVPKTLEKFPDGWTLSKNARGQKGADNPDDPVCVRVFSGTSDDRIFGNVDPAQHIVRLRNSLGLPRM